MYLRKCQLFEQCYYQFQTFNKKSFERLENLLVKNTNLNDSKTNFDVFQRIVKYQIFKEFLFVIRVEYNKRDIYDRKIKQFCKK